MLENKITDCLQQLQNAKNDDDIMDVFDSLIDLTRSENAHKGTN